METITFKEKQKNRLKLALENASEMILAHSETGLFPEDVNEKTEVGLRQYTKACDKASKMIKNF